MGADLLATLGKLAGIGGISLGVLLLVFQSVLRRNVFPTLGKNHAYNIIRLVIILTFAIAVLGICAWAFVSWSPLKKPSIVTHYSDQDKDSCMNARSASACDAYGKRVLSLCGSADAICRGRGICWGDKARAILIVNYNCELGEQSPSCQAQQQIMADLLYKDCDNN